MRSVIIVLLIFLSSSVFAQSTSELSKSEALTQPVRFPFQNTFVSAVDQPQPVQLNDGKLMMIFTSNDSLYCSLSSDGGISYANPSFIASFTRNSRDEIAAITATATATNRVVVVYSLTNPLTLSAQVLKFTYSDNSGSSWSAAQNVYSSMNNISPSISRGENNKLWISGRSNYLFFSTDNGLSWNSKSTGFTSNSLVQLKDNSILAFYKSADNIYLRKSTDEGTTWSPPQAVSAADSLTKERPRAVLASDGTIYLAFQVKKATPFAGINQYDIYFRKSTDNGNTWSETLPFTKYTGYDAEFNMTPFNNTAFISFLSDRNYSVNQIWSGLFGTTIDDNAPATLYKFSNTAVSANAPSTVTAYVGSQVGISNMELIYTIDNAPEQRSKMYDDGIHNDLKAGDNIWAGELPPVELQSYLQFYFLITDKNANTVKFTGDKAFLPAAVQYSWMSAGSLQNFYSSMGNEIEEELQPKDQQTGWCYPGFYKDQDMQANKGLWIGSRDFLDQNGIYYPYKVVHVGPRVTGKGEFFPIDFKTYSRFEPTKVIVNGKQSFNHSLQADIIDPSMQADRMITNTVNTQLGLTLRRKIMQFSREYNDNYIVQEYTFKNTGNVNADSKIELPKDTLKGLYFYFNYRWAINRQTRYVIGNATGWGTNTMLDARGDGVLPDPAGESFRTAFAWHGYFPSKVVQYNNIGAPIWDPESSEHLAAPDDSTGRLAGPQFVGVLTLHADKSPIDHSDNPKLPVVTFNSSDLPQYAANNAADPAKMKSEYIDFITKPQESTRHAYKIHPAAMTGGIINFKEFANQTNPPEQNTPGGFNANNSYGPYTLAPGDSVTIVIAEGAASISREASIEMGQKYKWAFGTPDFSKIEKQKNELVLTGKDSLMQTWKRVSKNYALGWNLPVPPDPPKEFTLTSAKDRIILSWKADDPAITGFELYRASGRHDGDYKMIKSLSSSEKTYNDTDITAGTGYFYYLLSKGSAIAADNELNIPAYIQKSGRYFTQTYDGISAGTSDVDSRTDKKKSYELYSNYPNPFNPSTIISYELPKQSYVELKVFDILGKEIATLVNEVKPAGLYRVHFDASSLPSGVYIYKISAGEFTKTNKMILLR